MKGADNGEAAWGLSRAATSAPGSFLACFGSCYQASVRDPYQVLGVSRSANDVEIKAAFRRLAAQHHPDKNGGSSEAQARFTEINLANQILSDPQKRAAYDRYGSAAFTPGQGPVGFDFSAIDSVFTDILGAFGFRVGERGDLKKTVQLSFEEAARGCTKELTYERVDICASCSGRGGASGSSYSPCKACSGRGRVRFQQGLLPFSVERTCSACRGLGKVPAEVCTTCRGSGLGLRTRTVEVTVPAGAEHQANRKVPHGGNRVSPDAEPGDLEVVLEVSPHPFFRRSGDDVVCAVPITFAQAALGGQLDVPTVWGKVALRIPPATQPGQVLRLKGQGLDRRLRGGRADQLVEVRIEVPTQLTPRARELIEELGQELGEDLQPQHKRFMDKVRELFR